MNTNIRMKSIDRCARWFILASLAVVLFFVYPAFSCAKATGVTGVYVTLGSYHVDKNWQHRDGFNERNPGLIVEINRKWLVGTYWNSFEQQTLLAGRRFDIIGPVYGFVALATGYRAPGIGGLCVEALSMQLCGIPPVLGHGGVFSFAYVYRF